MSHELIDRVSVILAQVVAQRLRDNPKWIDMAIANLDRWSVRNTDAPALLRCYDEWRAILDRPVDQICAVLLDRGEESTRLRQSSPFSGALSAQEVWSIKQRIRDESRAA